MNETESNPNVKQDLNPELIRAKLKVVTATYLPKLPSLVDKAKKDSQGMAKIAVSMLVPFLPQAQSLLLKTIDEATPEKLLEMVSFVEGVAEWLKNESLSIPTKE